MLIFHQVLPWGLVHVAAIKLVRPNEGISNKPRQLYGMKLIAQLVEDFQFIFRVLVIVPVNTKIISNTDAVYQMFQPHPAIPNHRVPTHQPHLSWWYKCSSPFLRCILAVMGCKICYTTLYSTYQQNRNIFHDIINGNNGVHFLVRVSWDPTTGFRITQWTSFEYPLIKPKLYK